VKNSSDFKIRIVGERLFGDCITKIMFEKVVCWR